MRNLTMSLMFFGIVITAHGTPLPEDAKKDVINSGMPACLAKQRQDSFAHLTTDLQKQEYCNCYMKQFANLLSVQDIERHIKTKSSDHYAPIVQKANSYCTEEFAKKWGYK